MNTSRTDWIEERIFIPIVDFTKCVSSMYGRVFNIHALSWTGTGNCNPVPQKYFTHMLKVYPISPLGNRINGHFERVISYHFALSFPFLYRTQ